MLSTTPIAEWLERHAGKRRVACSIPGGGIHNLSFLIFRLNPVDDSSAKAIQMKLSMTFIESNGWTDKDLILKQIWRRLI